MWIFLTILVLLYEYGCSAVMFTNLPIGNSPLKSLKFAISVLFHTYSTLPLVYYIM